MTDCHERSGVPDKGEVGGSIPPSPTPPAPEQIGTVQTGPLPIDPSSHRERRRLSAGILRSRPSTGDGVFYAPPRLVTHIDAGAIDAVGALYEALGLDGDVLDLMSSWVSHFRVTPANLTVLGMNAAELEANPQAAHTVVHDLNADPTLPFGGASFDAAVCCVSVDYLVHPIAVFREVSRASCAPMDRSCARSRTAVSPPRRSAGGSTHRTRNTDRSWPSTSGGREAGPSPRLTVGPRRPPRGSSLGRLGAPSLDSSGYEGLPARTARRGHRRSRQCGGARTRQGSGAARRVVDGANCKVRTTGEPVCVTTVLVVGLGDVGVRAARQLLDTPGIDRVVVGGAQHRAGARGRQRAPRRCRAVATVAA